MAVKTQSRPGKIATIKRLAKSQGIEVVESDLALIPSATLSLIIIKLRLKEKGRSNAKN